MNDDKIVTTLPLDRDLHADIKEIATEENRSMRGQVIHWLRFCVERYRARQRVGWWETGYVEVVEGEETEEAEKDGEL